MKSGIRFILSFVCLLAQLNFALAQSASLLPPAVSQFLDGNGHPLSGGSVNTYFAGTSVPKTTWQDPNQVTVNTNPIILNSSGEAVIYGNGTYTEQVNDQYGNQIWSGLTTPPNTSSTTIVGDGDVVGTIKPFAGIVPPNQYVFAYGQALSRTTYAALFSAITINTNVNCTASSAVLSGIADTTQISIGAPIENACLSGATVISKTSNTVTASSNSSTTQSAISTTFFPFGNGDGSTTFNLPDLRGYAVAGRDNMGNIAASRLTTTYFGANSPDAQGATGGSQSTTNSISIAQANLPNVNFAVSIPAGVEINGTTGVMGYVGPSANYSSSGSEGPQSWSQIINLPAMSGTAASGGSGTAISSTFGVIQPTITLNYIIKITPDTVLNTGTYVSTIGNYTSDNTLTITGTNYAGQYTGTVTLKCTVATISQIGCSKPDNSTITISAGVISLNPNLAAIPNLTTVGTITSGGLGTGATFGGVTAAFGTNAKGDIYTNSGSSNVIERLPIGTTSQCLTVLSGLPSWGSCAGGSPTIIANTTPTSLFSAGQLLYSDGSKVQAGTVGSGLTFSAGTLTANVAPITPQQYGAAGNGTTDDTTALNNATQAALTSGQCLYLGVGHYKITSTWNVYVTTSSPGDTASVPCIYGATVGLSSGTAVGAQVLWYGSTSGTAVQFEHTVHFTVQNFSLINEVASGTTQGILFTSDVTDESDSGPANISNVLVSGFYDDIVAGVTSGGHAVDTFTFTNLTVANASDDGVQLNASNTLNFNFVNLGMTGNAIGLNVQNGAGNVNVYGGSATGNTTTDFNYASSDTLGIYGFRTESENRFLLCGSSSSATPVIVTGATINASSNADGIVISGLNGACNLKLDSNYIAGLVEPETGSDSLSTLVMTNNQIYNAAGVVFQPTSSNNGLRYTLSGNSLLASNGTFASRFPNASGIVVGNAREDSMSTADCLVASQDPCAAGYGPMIIGGQLQIGASDVGLSRYGAGLLGLSNSTSPTTLQVYNTVDSTSSPTNYERAVVGFSGNVLKIGTQEGGTGTARNWEMLAGGTDVLDYGVTSVGNLYTPTYLFMGGTNAGVRNISGGLTLGNPTENYLFDLNGHVATMPSTGLLGWTNGTSYSGTLDTALYRKAAGVVEADNGTAGTYREFLARSYVVSGSTPTMTGTCTATSQTGGNTAGTFAASGACAAGTYIMTFGYTAPTGWACNAQDQTTSADTVKQTGSSTTTATFTATTASADVVGFNCVAF